MNLQPQFIKTTARTLFAAALLFGASGAFAQVKIGSNPTVIGTNSNLEVESSNGTKVMVDKVTGYLGAGVTDPTQSIDGSGTGRLRNIPTSSNNTEILTVDANGVIYKQVSNVATMPTVIGTLSAAGVDISALEANWVDTGVSITLPANSKYIVNVVMLLSPNAVLPAGTSVWVRGSFFNSPTGTSGSPDMVGGRLASGLVPANSSFALMTGAVRINNTSGAPKTYYFKAGRKAAVGSLAGYSLMGLGGAAGENQIYAVPYN